MVRPMYRSRSLRRIKVRTPGGRLVVHYEKRFASPPEDPITKQPLFGINYKRVKTDHSPMRPPSRPYGGVYSHKVIARAIRIAVRGGAKAE